MPHVDQITTLATAPTDSNPPNGCLYLQLDHARQWRYLGGRTLTDAELLQAQAASKYDR